MTWGEFGPILTVALVDSFRENLSWSRWQKSNTGEEVAVFRYTIPRSSSHYLIDFCCYQRSKEDPEMLRFRDKPGYHGELYLNPTTGVVDRITLEAELTEEDPVTASAISVEYGKAGIGGKSYVCPIYALAISEFHNRDVEVIDGVGLEKHINETHFLEYHKFGSTARIVAATPDDPDQQ
jgi:hypothetical protein